MTSESGSRPAPPRRRERVALLASVLVLAVLVALAALVVVRAVAALSQAVDSSGIPPAVLVAEPADPEEPA